MSLRNHTFPQFITFFIALFCISCGNVELKNFDNEAWKNDKEGCNGNRASQIETLIAQDSLLIGLHQQKINRLLGKPNRHNLRGKMNTSAEYIISGGKGCENVDSTMTVLDIEFEALTRVKLLTVQKRNRY